MSQMRYRFTPDLQLFDFEAFRTALATAPQPIPLFKAALTQVQQGLDARFRAGADIRDLIHGRAWFMDQLLAAAWYLFDWPDDHISLIAVGGYGRGELHPKSDIDLLILLGDEEDTPYREHISAFITFLWDIRLDIGHSVRSLQDCIREASADITVATNLLENRTLVGSDQLRQRMLASLAQEHMWPSDAFFEAKWQEQISRHYKFNNSEYNLEPNIKSSPGGLRDIQMIGWVAKRHFGVTSFDDLVERNFISETELRILTQGQAFLWQVRYGLHMLSGRSEDRLLFEYQRQLAELFGYSDNDERLAVEQFMKRYYRVVMSLAELNDVLLQHFDEVILSGQHSEEITTLNKRFRIRNGYIQANNNQVFERHPFALLEIFLLMAQNPEIQGVRASTIRAIRDHRHLIDEAFRQDLRNISLFMELLRSEGDVARQLSRMTRYGVLGKYLPEFGHVIGLMQHDLFHIYTVDAHTLKLLRFLREFQTPDAHERFPVASQVIMQLPKIELLYIAGLYHDIGKGRGGDHSTLGAADAQAFCQRHHLSGRDTRLVCWLVEHHLLMSMTAQKRDISDPEVIRDFAIKMRDQVHLDYLYVLTVADINATNPNLWNGWRAALLHQVYTETKRALRRGLENPIDKQEWIEETQQEALAILRALGTDETQATALWQRLDDDYFLQDSPSEVAWHTQGILQHGENPDPLVLISAPTDDMREGGTKVFIYAPAVDHLFAATVAAMEQLNLSIHDARISSTCDQYSLDTYIVLEQDGSVIRDPERLQQIRVRLIEELDDPEDYPVIVQRHTPRQLKHFTLPTQVTISNDPSNQRTVLEVITPDRPGLLARLGRLFLEFGISLQNAKIATLGERVEDIFFITDADQSPISDPELCQNLQAHICAELDRQASR